MKQALLALFLILNVSLILAGSDDSLDQLKQRILQSSAISASTLGNSEDWDYLTSGLNVLDNIGSSLSLRNIQTQFSTVNNVSELQVTATASLWKQDSVEVLFVFYYKESILDFYCEFEVDLDGFPNSIVPSTGSSWFNGLSLTGTNKISIATATFTDNKGVNYARGLSINANVLMNQLFPIQNDIQTMTQNDQIKAQITAVFPLTTGDPLASFTLNIESAIYFGTPSVSTSDLVLDLQVSSNSVTASLNTDLTITDLANSNQELVFTITSDIDTQQDTYTFKGLLEGSWNKPFDMQWLNFDNLAIDFDLETKSSPFVQSFQFNGQMKMSFVQEDVSVGFEVELQSGVEQVSMTVQVPIDDLTQLFNTIVQHVPPQTDELTVNGDLDLTLSTFKHDSFLSGLTLTGSISLSPSSSLATTLSAISSSSPLTLDLSLYIPVFTNASQFEFSLKQPNPFVLSQTIQLQDFTFDFDWNDVSLNCEVQVTDISQQDSSLTFTITSSLQSSKSFSLTGQLQGSWNQPFGLSWLSFKDVSSSLGFSNGALSAFEIQGDIAVTFGSVTGNQLSVTFNYPDFKDWEFSVMVFIPSVDMMNLSTSSLASSIALSGTLTLSSYSFSSFKQGLSITGDAIIDPVGQLAADLLSIDKDSDLNFSFEFYSNVFTSPSAFTLTLTESTPLTITQNIQLDNIQVTVGQSIQFQCDTTITLSQQEISANFQTQLSGNGQVSLAGQIEGNVNFGLKWLTLTSLDISMEFSKGLQSLEISGNAQVTVSSSTNTMQVTLQVAQDFENWYLELEEVTIISYDDAITRIGLTPPSQTSSLNQLNNKVSLTLSTYNDNSIKKGLTISDDVTVTGSILDKLSVFGDLSTFTFDLGLVLPIFSSGDIEIYLKASGFPIKKNLALTGFELEVDTEPLSFTVSTGLAVNFTHNPQLEFDVKGTFTSGGSVILSGDMLGTWEDMFGINGFSLSNVDIAVGFNPSLCAVDFCLSDLGFGYNMTMGTKTITFYGNAEIPEIENVFLEGSVSGANGMALSLQDMALEWNKIVGNEIGLPLNISDVPADWGFDDLSFYVAPVDGTFNQITYKQGFAIDGGIQFIGLNVKVDIQVSSNDFDFDIDIDMDEFTKLLNKELGFSSSNVTVGDDLLLRNVSLSEFSFNSIAHESDPLFYMDYDFFGPKTFAVRLPIFEIYQDFHHFFDVYLKDLFK